MRWPSLALGRHTHNLPAAADNPQWANTATQLCPFNLWQETGSLIGVNLFWAVPILRHIHTILFFPTCWTIWPTICKPWHLGLEDAAQNISWIGSDSLAWTRSATSSGWCFSGRLTGRIALVSSWIALLLTWWHTGHTASSWRRVKNPGVTLMLSMSLPRNSFAHSCMPRVNWSRGERTWFTAVTSWVTGNGVFVGSTLLSSMERSVWVRCWCAAPVCTLSRWWWRSIVRQAWTTEAA